MRLQNDFKDFQLDFHISGMITASNLGLFSSGLDSRPSVFTVERKCVV